MTTTDHRVDTLDGQTNGQRIPRELDGDDVVHEPLTTPPPSAAERNTVEATATTLPQVDSQPSTDRWQRIQSVFVDDPRQAVTEAHREVTNLMQRIDDVFSKEQSELDRLSGGDTISTEDLRVRLQRYRTYFSQLSSSLDGLSSAR